ncbi:Kiwa anti-phage protein KwaB-like domain-containing protein [Terrimonas rubra]|uniref:Kiwa anti-phage protein KwaB-like domain-containing protein n=1 Tax=Terrimonas rubra TaxID=1035890 RepID=A0ABW6A8N6_9BACT
MTPKKLLKELHEFTNADAVHMYIIERKLKSNVKSSSRPSEKFQYIPVQINLSPELVPLVSGMLKKAIEQKVTEDIQILDYEPIDDTLEKVYTYSDLGKITGFKEFLANLGNEMKTLTSFKELEDLEKAWALCYGYYDANKKKWLYCIKKLSPKKIAVEVNVNTTVKEAIKYGIQSFFDIKTQMLKPLNGFSINLDPSIDMVYHDETIYIFQKKAFEELASLTEEFEELAKDVVQELENLEIVEGATFIASVVADKPSFRNKLIKAQVIGNIEFLSGKEAKEVKKEFNRVGKRLNIKFNFGADGKILVANDDDAKNIINVLCELYKEGLFGGKIFESPAGRIKKS